MTYRSLISLPKFKKSSKSGADTIKGSHTVTSTSSSHVYASLTTDTLLTTLSEDLKQTVQESLLDDNKLELADLLSTAGKFGALYSAWFMEGTQRTTKVLVKTFRVGGSVPDAVKKKFLRHATALLDFNHRNVLLLEGIVIRDQVPLAAYTWTGNGNLREFLSAVRKNTRPPLEDDQRYNWIKDAAEGMHYLSLQGFIHGDVAARNCFITDPLTLKLADPALSSDLYPGDYVPGANDDVIPLRWAAPEVICGDEDTVESDVFSFGTLVWEIATLAERPYSDMNNEEVKKFVTFGNRMLVPEGCLLSVYSLMLSCWDKDPNKRPEYHPISEFMTQLLNGEVQKFNNPTATQD